MQQKIKISGKALRDQYRKAAPEDIDWGKTVLQCGERDSRTVYLYPMKIEKIKEEDNEQRLHEMKSIEEFYVEL